MPAPHKLIALIAFAATTTIAGGAFAQSAGADGANPPAAGGAAGAAASGGTGSDNTDVQATLHTEGGHRVYVATSTIEVHGEIQRPYVFTLSGRSSLGYTYLELPVHFVQEIINAVRHAPF